MARAAEDGFPAGVIGYAMEPVFAGDVQLSASTDVREASTDPANQWLDVVEGRQPTGPGEALADVNAAKGTGVEVGDVLRVGAGDDVVEVTVVGMVDSPTAASADLYVPWADLRRFTDSMWVTEVAWGGSADLARELAPAGSVVDVDAHVAQEQADIARGVDYISYLALLFVAIALFVAVMVIANTFSILFAQRMRDFALLRCVGVTRRQLRRSVRLEALLLGLVASLVGVLVGVVAGLGLVVLVGRWFTDIGDATFSVAWVLGAVAVGTLVTLAAAWLPTRAVTRVTPLAALRPDTGVDVRSAAGRWRICFAVLFVLAGSGRAGRRGLRDEHAADARRRHRDVPRGAAAGSAPGAGRHPAGRSRDRGRPGTPARGGQRRAEPPSYRHDRGVAARGRHPDHGGAHRVGDLTQRAGRRDGPHGSPGCRADRDRGAVGGRPRRPRASRRGRARDRPPGGDLRPRGQGEPAPGRCRTGPGRRPRTERLLSADGVVQLPYDVVNALTGGAGKQWRKDGTVTVEVGGRTRTLDVVQGSGWGRAGLVSSDTLAALTTDAFPAAVWVRVADGTDPEDLDGDLAVLAAGPKADLDGGYADRHWVDVQVDVLTGAVVGLLGIAVVIALIGIGNTLGLSVLERARENALLRAMGLTRSQLRRAMATEGLLLSLVATGLGMVLGVVFAWVAVQVMVSTVVAEVSMTLPVGQLAAMVVVAAVAGLAACVLPARRAAQAAPAAGLALG